MSGLPAPGARTAGLATVADLRRQSRPCHRHSARNGISVPGMQDVQHGPANARIGRAGNQP